MALLLLLLLLLRSSPCHWGCSSSGESQRDCRFFIPFQHSAHTRVGRFEEWEVVWWVLFFYFTFFHPFYCYRFDDCMGFVFAPFCFRLYNKQNKTDSTVQSFTFYADSEVCEFLPIAVGGGPAGAMWK